MCFGEIIRIFFHGLTFLESFFEQECVANFKMLWMAALKFKKHGTLAQVRKSTPAQLRV